MDQPPDGMRSYLVASIEEAVASVDGSPIAGVIVLTDGVTQERPLDLEQRIAALDVPVFFLAPGKGSGRDIALSLAGEAPLAFVRNTRTLRLAVSGRGLDGFEAMIKVQIPVL